MARMVVITGRVLAPDDADVQMYLFDTDEV
jgi:hypothetical protein